MEVHSCDCTTSRKGGTMKPTEQEIEVLAQEYAKTHGKVRDCQFHFIKGFKEAISQMQPEWVACIDRLPGDETYAIIWRKGYSPEQTVARQVFDFTHAVYCFIDNSLNKYAIGEIVTHWSPLLESPTK